MCAVSFILVILVIEPIEVTLEDVNFIKTDFVWTYPKMSIISL